jgi:hypothetical protein
MSTPIRRIQLEQIVKNNCSPKTILDLLKFDYSEAINKIKKQTRIEDLRYTQGELRVLDQYITLLSKTTS